jgi:transposase
MALPYWNNNTKRLSDKLWFPTMDKSLVPYREFLYPFDTKNKNISFNTYTTEDACISNRLVFNELEPPDFDSIIEKRKKKQNKNESCTVKRQENKEYKNIAELVKKLDNTDIKEHLDVITKFIQKSVKIEQKQKEDAENRANRYAEEIDNCYRVIRAKKIALFLTSTQKRTILSWMKAYRFVYNRALNHIKKHNGPYNFQELRDTVKPKISPQVAQILPDNVMAGAFSELCDAYKSNFTKKHDGQINCFDMSFKKRELVETLTVEKGNFNDNSFYITYLGPIILTNDPTFDFSKVKHDCTLSYDRRSNQFTLNVPQDIVRKHCYYRKKCVALDPGERTFQTFYGLNHVGKIGDGIKHEILRHKKQIDIIQKILIKQVKKLKDDDGHIYGEKRVNKRVRKNLKRALYRVHQKIRNLVTEMHNKIALFLVCNYDRILIPKFNVQGMIKNGKKKKKKRKKKRKKAKLTKSDEDALIEKKRLKKKKYNLNKKVKWVLLKMRHYGFRQHLHHKSEEYGCKAVDVEEHYTSKTCIKCGYIHRTLGSAKVYKCPCCRIEIDRDFGGSIGVFLKNFWTVGKLPIKQKLDLRV